MSGFFITGTDTGVGKTFVACALIHALQRRGLTVAAMKPIAAGGSIPAAGNAMPAAGSNGGDGELVNEDVALLLEATGHRDPPNLVNPYCFKEAIAPHLAARHDGVAIDMSVIQAAYRHLAGRADLVIVEGAGGFLVPLSDDESMALIPVALKLPVILVVGMRLGCLNHALLTQEAIRSRGLMLAGWIANSPAPGNSMNAREENLATLVRLIDAPLIGDIAHVTLALATGAKSMNPTGQATRQAAVHLATESLIPLPRGN